MPPRYSSLAIVAALVGAIYINLHPTVACAEADARTFLQVYDKADLADQQALRRILEWIASGMVLANSDLHSNHRQLIFCQPSKLALTGEQLLDMIQREMQDEPAIAEYPVGFVVLQSLKKIFPCAR